MRILTAAALLSLTATGAFPAAHAAPPSVEASDRTVLNGVVSADVVMATKNGWMVAHRTDSTGKPGPVVGYAPLRHGMNTDVAAILTETVAPGDMLMLMVHAETGGMKTGIFEYTLGAKEDGPIKIDGNLVMKTITALAKQA